MINEISDNKIRAFYDLEVWKEAHDLVLLTYKTTKSFPSEEVFGLVSQMRRAAVSVTSNIAEGFGRTSLNEKIRFYTIARGSLTELQNQLFVARDISYLTSEDSQNIERRIVRTLMMLHRLIASLTEKLHTRTTNP